MAKDQYSSYLKSLLQSKNMPTWSEAMKQAKSYLTDLWTTLEYIIYCDQKQ